MIKARIIHPIAIATALLTTTLFAQSTPHPINPHPYPKPALLSDTVTAADYATVILSPALQAALKVTEHQRAVFDAMRKRFDYNFSNVMGMDVNPALNVARTQRVLDLTGSQIRDQLTIDQDKQLQDYFAKKILAPVTVESQDSDTPVYNPHLVYVPGVGPHYVQGTVFHSGSITIHYTKFSEANPAGPSKPGDPPPTAPPATPATPVTTIATETIDVSDLPALDPDEKRHRDELRQHTREHAAQFHNPTNPSPTPMSATPATPTPPTPTPTQPPAPPSAPVPQIASATPITPPQPTPALSPAPRPHASLHRPTQTTPLRVPPVTPPNTSPLPSTDKLSDSFLQTLSAAFTTNAFVVTRPVGGAFADQSALDLPANPGLLIGFDLGTGDFMGNKTIQSLTPIYLTAAGEVRGHLYGLPGLPSITLKAKDGYALGGITARGGGGLDGISLLFMKRTPSALDPNNTYSSQSVGMDLNERAEDLSGNGTPITGILVKVGDRGFLGLGLIFANPIK